MTLTLDWNAIRPLNGDRSKGFEELCAQLARAEVPAGASFERKGTPDAGVECFAILPNGDEWGWQSKYFDAVGKSQWSQLDDSVQTALAKHPRLVRYFACLPLDLPDGRVDGQRSARDQWNNYVASWTIQASAKGMVVEFVYWGSHQLLEQLAQPRHAGRVRFWFDAAVLDQAWFLARLDEALKTAGPRYTPAIHVDLPLARKFEALGRTEQLTTELKTHARHIRDASRPIASGSTEQPDLDTRSEALLDKTRKVCAQLSELRIDPNGELPLAGIVAAIDKATDEASILAKLLSDAEARDEAPKEGGPPPRPGAYRNKPFRDRHNYVQRLAHALEEAREALVDAESLAGASLVILRGDAGTGKTHLLCDVGRSRLKEHRPTVVLMGQRFVSDAAPWTQALEQLDLGGFSAEEFVGALESAAQVVNRRALVLLDAVNEGAGRTIWPPNLAAFVAALERSTWITLVVSVRTSYEELVIPKEVQERALSLTHHGFAQQEYDAMRTFFEHYGLELPSTPLLALEFQSPLFLKTLCCGLAASGLTRIPRGAHGVTAIFDLYLKAINERLAVQLGFNSKLRLIHRALERLCDGMVAKRQRWLTLKKASEIVDAELPGREFHRSLYHGLVAEGLVIEESGWRQEIAGEEVAYIAYERFADHLIANALFDKYLDPKKPAEAFQAGGPLAFLTDETNGLSAGLLEASCVQLPERVGREFLGLVPTLSTRWGIAEAFRQSLLWRAASAFSDETRSVLKQLNARTADDSARTLDVLLTLSVLPDHPFNAEFLDKDLRNRKMAERDAFWSTYLHRAWGTESAVDRLVDWAASSDRVASLDDASVDLYATTLAWMFTTSNRFLRDRATKTLVRLLTGRLEAARRLVERFAYVDDPYVAERIFAAAYGVAMRSRDAHLIGALATTVFRMVFSPDVTRPHVLLRDYARGVVERAVFLGAAVGFDPARARPPYRTTWPKIPSEDDVQGLRPDWSKGARDNSEVEWSFNSIGSSVVSGDFARYVIGETTNWTSLRLNDTPWRLPACPDDLLMALIHDFSDEEGEAYSAYLDATRQRDDVLLPFISEWFAKHKAEQLELLELELEQDVPVDAREAHARVDVACQAFLAALTQEHRDRYEAIQTSRDTFDASRHPPRFDCTQLQRYILWRVFDLGWTTERFGLFDRFSVSDEGRDAHKPERMGKKYQWIAYHEISAYISDHFQYRERHNEERGDQQYEGPWQEWWRDIDPSCTLRTTKEEKGRGDDLNWWEPQRYANWEAPEEPSAWVASHVDLPSPANLLIVTQAPNGPRWANMNAFFRWQQPVPPDKAQSDVDKREVWFMSHAQLLAASDVDKFMQWAETVDFWGRWMPEPPQIHNVLLGEHGWAPASKYFEQQYTRDGVWEKPKNCPTPIRAFGVDYVQEGGNFDCSVDEGFTIRLPASDLVVPLGVTWTGCAGDFVDERGVLAVQAPTAHASRSAALLVREDCLRDFLQRQDFALCWSVVGEKRIIRARHDEHVGVLELAGAYRLTASGLIGFLKCRYRPRNGAAEMVMTVRT